MNTESVVCYNYLDEQGRRLANFCRFTDETTAEIFTLACSKADNFSKKLARKVYENYLKMVESNETFNVEEIALTDGNTLHIYHPTIETITIEPEKRELQTLLRYCRDNFFVKLFIPVEDEVEMLLPAIALDIIENQ